MPFKKGESHPFNTKYYTDEVIDKLAVKLWEWVERPTSCWFEAFCVENKLDHRKMSEFGKTNANFQKAYDYAKTWQKQKLIEGGLLGKFNPTITKLLLSNLYNITEKQTIQHEGAQPVEVVHYGKKDPKKWESNSQ
jgi:hypothetical protein